MVKFKQKTTITKRNTWWNLIIAIWRQKEENAALPEFMRQAHYFKNKHNCKKLCEQKQENEYLFKKSILYFMEKNMKNTKKRYVKARRQ